MDEILREGRRRERRSDLVLGAIVLAGGLVLWVGARETLGGQLRALYVMPAAAVSFGFARIVRAMR
jgi:hypothetical protein